MNKYKLYEYEVWGNDDGHEVNNLYPLEGEYEITEDMTDKEILAMIEASDNVEIDNNGSSLYGIYLRDKDNGKPLGELRLFP